jgi:hypothetical protein
MKTFLSALILAAANGQIMVKDYVSSGDPTLDYLQDM